MKTKNSFGIHFTLRSDREKDGRAPVLAVVTINGHKATLVLKDRITVACWDLNRGAGKPNTSEGKKINQYLEEVRQALTDCYKELQLQRKIITADAIKAAFSRTDSDEHTLSEIAQYHNEAAKGVLAPGTMKNYYTTQKYLQQFVKQHHKTENYYLADLNYKFINDFELFLRKHQPIDHQKPLTNNGIMKHLERFRKMINMAFRLEWINRDPFAKFQLKFNRVEKEFLTTAELTSLEKLPLRLPRLSIVRDIFIFSCYTGLAFVDVSKLTRSQIVTGEDGGLWIKTTREKTTIPVNVPLLEQARLLVERYEDNIKADNKGTIFPVLSNQKMNSYLKELAERCNIDKTLTFHMARHTFATTVTLLNGVPLETVSKLLGHTTMRSTQVYAKVVEQKVSQDMALLNKKLNQ